MPLAYKLLPRLLKSSSFPIFGFSFKTMKEPENENQDEHARVTRNQESALVEAQGYQPDQEYLFVQSVSSPCPRAWKEPCRSCVVHSILTIVYYC